MTWEIDDVDFVCDECPEVKNGDIKVVIKPKALLKVISLLKRFPELEWGAFCIGTKRRNIIYVKDIKVPKQVVTKANISFENNEFPENCVGWIHSHNSMDAYLSSTDKTSAPAYSATIVVNNKIDLVAAVKQKLSCKRYALVEAEVEIEVSKDIEEELKNIQEKAIEIRDGNLWHYYENTCKVCGRRLSKNKHKVKYCVYCDSIVHPKCFVKEKDMCLECFEEHRLGLEKKEPSRASWRDYID